MRPSDDRIAVAVREAIARRLGMQPPSPSVGAAAAGHASFVLLRVTPGSDGDGACLIEPAVACTHCGYCQSFGH